MDAVFSIKMKPEILLLKATKIYSSSINRINSVLMEIRKYRENRMPIPARLIWKIGDIIFMLRDDLKHIGLQLDGLYDHLTRDLKVKRKWLEKVIILRRYVSDKNLIPKSLNWGSLEKGTGRKAKKLQNGLPLA